MNSAITLFLFSLILIVLPVMSSIARRKRFEASMKRYLDERKMQSSSVKQQDTKTKKGLFHEPSWDDE